LNLNQLTQMSDDTTLPGINRPNFADITDITDSTLITDFTQIVSCVVGKDRIARKRQKIREELIREHINSKHQVTPSLLTQFFNIFRRN
jgi:hypothetical protein